MMSALPLNSVAGDASRTEDTLYIKGYAVQSPCVYRQSRKDLGVSSCTSKGNGTGPCTIGLWIQRELST